MVQQEYYTRKRPNTECDTVDCCKRGSDCIARSVIEGVRARGEVAAVALLLVACGVFEIQHCHIQS